MAARPAEIDYVPVPLPTAVQPSRRTARSSARRAAYRSQPIAADTVASPRAVQPIAPQQQLPSALRNLVMLQRSSSVVLFVLGTLTLGVYSRTVHAQRSWSNAYSELALLRRQEPQLTLANEALKQHLADNAEQQDSGLVNPDPFNALFLEPAAPRPLRDTSTVMEEHQPPQLQQPLSY